MKKTEHCTTQNMKGETGCHVTKGIQTVQPFPTDGLLVKNLNLELAKLARQIGHLRDTARSYIVDTVRMQSDKQTNQTNQIDQIDQMNQHSLDARS